MRKKYSHCEKHDEEITVSEKILKENSKNSVEELIRYILFEMQSPIEDYFSAIDLITENYPKSKDIRLAILGAYLSSTWLNFKDNVFLKFLDEHLDKADNQNKAIIYYLHSYDIYIKCDGKYPKEYADYLRKSVSCSNRFVYNYVRLAEIADKREAGKLLDRAISNVETVWSEEQLKNVPTDIFLEYDKFVDEFILGVDISTFEYEDLLAKRKKKSKKKI